MMNRYSRLLLPLFAVIIGGCKTVNTYERDKPTYHANHVKDARIETDGFLADKASVQDIRQTTVQGDLMMIQVEILNTNPWEGNFDYKFEWFDEHGMMVDSPTSTWDSHHIQPEEVISLQAVAPNGRCKDFRLKLQRSQRL